MVGEANWYADNLAWWEERVPLHVDGEFYAVPAWLAGEEQLRQFELDELGDVSGLTLVHPQCHFGQDTLGWARHGASVTGVDFSPAAVEAARHLADRAGLSGRFVCADVYDAPVALGNERFDVVYTGLGAVNWLDDLQRWAGSIAALCRPGGTFYLAEFHPFSTVFDDETDGSDLEVRYDYFDHEWHDTAETYTGSYGAEGIDTAHNDTHEHVWTLGEVVSAVISAGFDLEFLHEHEFTLFRQLPFLERVRVEVEGSDGPRSESRFVLPEGRARIPMMYSLRAIRR